MELLQFMGIIAVLIFIVHMAIIGYPQPLVYLIIIIGVFWAVATYAHDSQHEPDEARKAWALRRAYELNGNSMVRPLGLGSIDLSKEAPPDIVDPHEVNAVDSAADKPAKRRKRRE